MVERDFFAKEGLDLGDAFVASSIAMESYYCKFLTKFVISSVALQVAR